MVNQHTVLAARAGAPYPEAVVKMANLGIGLIFGDIAEGRFHNQPNPEDPGRVVNNFFHSLTMGLGAGDVSVNFMHAQAVTEALTTGDSSALNDEQMSYYERSRGWVDRTNLAGYTSYSIFGPTGSQWTGEYIRQNNLFYKEPFFGPSTDAMNDNIGTLRSRRDEVITNIILGGDVDSNLQDFQNFWDGNFGPTITEEVNEWWRDFHSN